MVFWFVAQSLTGRKPKRPLHFGMLGFKGFILSLDPGLSIDAKSVIPAITASTMIPVDSFDTNGDNRPTNSGCFANACGGPGQAALTNFLMSDARTIAIGDIHGCRIALDTLLASLDLGLDDTAVILGDVIDRGPESRGVLERLLALRDSCRLVPILGNHEQMLLDAVDARVPLQDWLIHGGAETLDSYGADAALGAVPKSHVDFLRSWGDYYETESHFFVHGNYLSGEVLARQPWQSLRWESLRTRTPATHCSGKTAVMGHTSDKSGKILDLGHLVCIDTYCHGGYWLTALEPSTRKIWQANESGELCESTLPLPKKS